MWHETEALFHKILIVIVKNIVIVEAENIALDLQLDNEKNLLF